MQSLQAIELLNIFPKQLLVCMAVVNLKMKKTKKQKHFLD